MISIGKLSRTGQLLISYRERIAATAVLYIIDRQTHTIDNLSYLRFMFLYPVENSQCTLCVTFVHLSIRPSKRPSIPSLKFVYPTLPMFTFKLINLKHFNILQTNIDMY